MVKRRDVPIHMSDLKGLAKVQGNPVPVGMGKCNGKRIMRLVGSRCIHNQGYQDNAVSPMKRSSHVTFRSAEMQLTWKPVNHISLSWGL